MPDERDTGPSWWIHRRFSDDASLDDPDRPRLLGAVDGRDWFVVESPAGTDRPPVALSLIRVDEDRWACDAMIIGLADAYPLAEAQSPPATVTSTELHRLRVPELIDQALASNPGFGGTDYVAQLLGRAPAWESTQRGPNARAAISDDDLEAFATAYAALLDEAHTARVRNPQAQIARAMNMDRSNLYRWRKRAIAAGHLTEPATEEGPR